MPKVKMYIVFAAGNDAKDVMPTKFSNRPKQRKRIAKNVLTIVL
jgi:hypothetical protein